MVLIFIVFRHDKKNYVNISTSVNEVIQYAFFRQGPVRPVVVW